MAAKISSLNVYNNGYSDMVFVTNNSLKWEICNDNMPKKIILAPNFILILILSFILS